MVVNDWFKVQKKKKNCRIVPQRDNLIAKVWQRVRPTVSKGSPAVSREKNGTKI